MMVSNFRQKRLAWFNAYQSLLSGKRPVMCPTCGLGELSAEIATENSHEVRVFCDRDANHSSFFLYSDASESLKAVDKCSN